MFEVDQEEKLTQTVRDVKLKLRSRDPSMPPASVKLIFKGMTRADDTPLRDIKGFKNGSQFDVKYDRSVAQEPEKTVFCPSCKARVTSAPEDVPVLGALAEMITEYKSLSQVFGKW